MNPNQPWGPMAQPMAQPQAQSPAPMPTPWGQPQPMATAPAQNPMPAAPAPNGFTAPAPVFGQQWGNSAAMAPARPTLVDGDGPPLSFRPDSFTQGGMIDNVWVRFDNGRAITFDYKGKSSSGPAPAVAYDLTIVDAKTGQPLPGVQAQEKVWTVGGLDDFQPKKNGRQFWSPTGKTGFNKNSNWATFIEAALKAGVPPSAFDAGDAAALNGVVAFVSIVKTDRGMNAANGQSPTFGAPPTGPAGPGDRGDRGVLVITQLAGGPARPMAQPQPQPQAQAPMAPAPMAPMAPMAVSQPAPAAQAPMAQGPDPNAAAQLLREVMGSNPTSKQAFQVALFSRAMMDAPLRELVNNPQFQAQVLGAPVNLP